MQCEHCFGAENKRFHVYACLDVPWALNFLVLSYLITNMSKTINLYLYLYITSTNQRLCEVLLLLQLVTISTGGTTILARGH